MQKTRPPSTADRLTRLEQKVGIDPKDHGLRNGLIVALTSVGITVVLAWATYITIGVISLKQAAKSAGIDLIADLKTPGSQQQLQANLSTVIAQVQTARVHKVKPDPKKFVPLTDAVSQVLKDSPSVPEAWQAASVLISYRSQIAGQVQLAPCSSRSASVQNAGSNGDGVIHIDNLLVHGCTLILDDPQSLISVVSRMIAAPGAIYEVGTLSLTNVHVIYRGGLINVAKSIVFVNCTFDFNEYDSPKPRGQKVTEQLLAAIDQGSVSVDLQGASNL